MLSVIFCKMASGNLNYTTSTWIPTYFVQVLKVSPLQTAAFLMPYTAVDIVGGFAVAGAESALLRRGVSQVSHPFNTGCLPLSYSGNPGVNVSYREGGGAGQLSIRKGFQAACVVGRSVCLLAFGMVRNPLLAALLINMENAAR